MFSMRSKFNTDLKESLDNDNYKYYRVIIKYKELKENLDNKIKSLKGEILTSSDFLKITVAYLTSKSLSRIAELPYVEYITFDEILLVSGSSVLSSNGIAHTEKYKLTGKGVCVGIVDTGTYPHEDLLHPNSKIKAFYDCINNYKYPYDDNGHGTFMSGLICSSGYLSKGMYRGIAPEASLYSIKAFNSLGRGYASDILFSIELLIKESENYNIKVICLPFEMLNENSFIKTLFSKIFDLACEKGLCIVVPSGNGGPLESTIKGFASLDSCITVGGLDTRGEITSYIYSSRGPLNKLEKPNLSAACADICSLNSNTVYLSERNGFKVYPPSLEKPYTSYSGTSCSAAFISGICALLYQSNKELTLKDIKSTLKVSCDMKNLSRNIQGEGMIDINKL